MRPWVPSPSVQKENAPYLLAFSTSVPHSCQSISGQMKVMNTILKSQVCLTRAAIRAHELNSKHTAMLLLHYDIPLMLT